MFPLPYSRRLRYLTGIDWILGAMNHIALRSTGVGAISQAVLHIDGRIDENRLRESLDQISTALPILHGKPARDFVNLCPYWKVPPTSRGREIPLRVVDLPSGSDDEAERILDEHANTPFDGESKHLRFLLVRIGERSKLGMVFDHRLFDAFGAEAMFRLIDETAAGRLAEIAPRIKVTEDPGLNQWFARLASGRKLLHQLYPAREKTVAALPRLGERSLGAPSSRQRRRVLYAYENLSAEESARFDARAGEESLIQILLPSAAARAVIAMRRVFPIPPLLGEQYLLFTSANTRPPGQEWERLLFNQFSFIFFTADNAEKPTATDLAVKLRDQLFEMMKLGIPDAMIHASALWRIFPHPLVAWIMNTMGGGRMCSFYFACVRETGYPSPTFLGLPATDLTHSPLAFAPPGMNICMTRFADRFNLVLSYVEGTLDPADAKAIMREFKAALVT